MDVDDCVTHGVIWSYSYNSSMDDADRFSELQQLLAQARYHVQNAENAELVTEHKYRVKLEHQFSNESSQNGDEEKNVKLREKTNLKGNMVGCCCSEFF